MDQNCFSCPQMCNLLVKQPAGRGTSNRPHLDVIFFSGSNIFVCLRNITLLNTVDVCWCNRIIYSISTNWFKIFYDGHRMVTSSSRWELSCTVSSGLQHSTCRNMYLLYSIMYTYKNIDLLNYITCRSITFLFHM